jgi:hypothetical protein
MPIVEAAFGANGPGGLWEYHPGMENTCRRLIHEFMNPFPISRFLSARARDICLLLPRIQAGTKRGRVIRHPEYRHGLELYSLLLAATEQSLDELADWPSPRQAPRRDRGSSAPRQRQRRPAGRAKEPSS